MRSAMVVGALVLLLTPLVVPQEVNRYLEFSSEPLVDSIGRLTIDLYPNPQMTYDGLDRIVTWGKEYNVVLRFSYNRGEVDSVSFGPVHVSDASGTLAQALGQQPEQSDDPGQSSLVMLDTTLPHTAITLSGKITIFTSDGAASWPYGLRLTPLKPTVKRYNRWLAYFTGVG